MRQKIDAIQSAMESIYGRTRGQSALNAILPLLEGLPTRGDSGKGYFSENDAILITYGGSLREDGIAPLETLGQFAAEYLKESFSAIHILPFFPFSSDDGFSVIDFLAVDPQLGSWSHIENLGVDFQLMFDLVLNHISAKSSWYDRYLKGEDGFEDLAIEIEDGMDLSGVVRPRALPLFVNARKASGDVCSVWTTFSEDQIDLNYKSTAVLEKMVRVLLHYIARGARFIRLDAIAYLWKESGTSCIHLPEAHGVVRLFRAILDLIAPDVRIITETNVPHQENISYFGDGGNEAQLVYNFTLPPLLLHSFIREDARRLSEWVGGLTLASEENTFLNFTASHDGIGVRPLEGILPSAEIDVLAESVRGNGGLVSEYQTTEGTRRPYELNISYIDALARGGVDGPERLAERFLASQAVQYVLPGVPATYIHSLLGSRNWKAGVEQTQRARTINRAELGVSDVTSEMKNPETFRFRIVSAYIRLAAIRRRQPAFHPNASFSVLELDSRVFALERHCERQRILTLTNVSSEPVSVRLPKDYAACGLVDLLTESEANSRGILLRPYQYVWLNAE